MVAYFQCVNRAADNIYCAWLYVYSAEIKRQRAVYTAGRRQEHEGSEESFIQRGVGVFTLHFLRDDARYLLALIHEVTLVLIFPA
mmetsp:Transcript_32189/g.52263  ORF Transcript_32189/g.52263 Transcript_32189/m.52263 type:complete len:85 (-) Transcript_32189:99-353(-)